MGNKRGITLTTIIIYVILFFLFTSVITVLSTRLNKGLFDDRGMAININNVNKLEYNLLESAEKSLDATVEEVENNMNVVFSNGDRYVFDETKKTIYKNGGVLAKDVANFTVTGESTYFTVDATFKKYLNEMTRSIKIANRDIPVENAEDEEQEQKHNSLIPEGFYYVGGSISTGLVISDNIADENKGAETDVVVISDELIGNQFVWVPVNDIEAFVRQEGYYNLSIQSFPSNSSEPYVVEGYTAELEEYNAMKASVEEHKGFYIGRYEAGSETLRQYYETAEANGTTNIVVKKGAYVYNFVGWGPSMTSTTGNVINDSAIGQNEGKGAVQLSREMYAGSSSVGSHLIYGVEWDAALRFIDPEYTGFAKNSVSLGNYNSSLKNTGYYALKNIYDMAGNVYEWTMEAKSTNYRINRGGDYSYYGYVFPASFRRSDYHPNHTLSGIGFRTALYIK